MRAALSVRARLTLWYLAAVTLVLLGYCGGVYSLVRNSLFESIDRQLRQDLEAAEEEQLFVGDRDRWILEIWSVDGELLRAWPEVPAKPLGSPLESCRSKMTTFSNAKTFDGLRLRVACREASREGGVNIIRAARSSERAWAQLLDIETPMVLGLPVAALFAALGGFFLARRALRPVQQMSDQARSISASRLGQRLEVPNPTDELGQLATTFNETFARLEYSFEQMRRFTADASHELRSPLAAIRTMGEVALKNGGDYREVLSSILEETDSLRELTDDLLTLSRADAGQMKLAIGAVDSGAMVREVAEQLEVLADEKQQTIVCEVEPGLMVSADVRVLKRAVINLIDNAIKYSPPGSRVSVFARRLHAGVELRVVDQGPGIRAEFHERIFERFFRLDEARSRQQQGSGLGLALARWAVEAQGGHLRVESDGEHGSTFVIDLDAQAGA